MLGGAVPLADTLLPTIMEFPRAIDRSHDSTAIWWPLGVAVVSVTCMRARCVSHTWKYTQWNIFLFESSDKSPYWINPYHIGFRYEVSLNYQSYFGQCSNDIYILLHIALSCLSYPHTGLATAMAPSGHQMAIVVSQTVYSNNVTRSTEGLSQASILWKPMRQYTAKRRKHLLL